MPWPFLSCQILSQGTACPYPWFCLCGKQAPQTYNFRTKKIRGLIPDIKDPGSSSHPATFL